MRGPGEGAEPLRVGDTVEVTIEKGVYRGRGLGRVGGRVVFVPRAHPGDRVRACVRELHVGWAEGSLVEVLEPSSARRVAPCPYAGPCGGCAYQEIQPDAQLRLKEGVLRESLARAGVPWHGEIETAQSAERGWRMRASLHFVATRAGLLLGLRQEGTRRVVDVASCLQLSETMNRVSRGLRDALEPNDAVAPRLRGLDLLEAPDRSGLVAVLDTGLRPQQIAALVPLAGRADGLTGLGASDAQGRLHWLHGDPHVETTVLGVHLRAHARSFFQGNRFLLEPLARTVVDLVPSHGGRLLDLYSGVGLFALPLAAREGGEVLAVEHAGFSSEDARWNARRNGLAVRVVLSGVAEALAAIPCAGDERIVLDPPRTGAGPEVVDLLSARAPAAIVYVSCDPPTLGRDLARFAARGYSTRSVYLFDLFPDTFHVETVVLLRRS